MWRLIPLILLFMASMACGATIETIAQSSSSPYSLIPTPPVSAPLPASNSPVITEISPKIIPKEPTQHQSYRKQFIISIFVERDLDTSISIPVVASIDYAIKRWNQALGYEVFSFLEGDKTLKIEYKNEIGSYGGKRIGGLYYKKDCKNQLIELYIPNNGNIKQNAMHELGHAIGLSHSTSDLDVMYPSVKYTLLELSINDVSRAKETIKLRCQ